MTFADFGLSESILRAIAADGYHTPTPVQAAAIPHVLAGRDVLGSAQTGTGKTAAFALPLLHRMSQADAVRRGPSKPRALILSPTRELAVQIQDSCRAYGRHLAMRSTVVIGGVGQQSQVRALQRGTDLLIATPGRLVDLYQQGFVKLDAVEHFVLDEADRMLDMGFVPAVKRIIGYLPPQRQTLLFSATMPPAIAALAAGILRDPAHVRVAPVKATTALIDQAVCFVPQAQKAKLLIALLKQEAADRVIVFTRTKRGADRVAEQLRRTGIRAEAIHGNKSQNARQRALENFKSKRPPILVATDLAARGIDVDEVSHVFNFDLPDEPETYVHRIGRTGRAGAEGKAMAFCSPDERQQLAGIERLLRSKLPVYRGAALAEINVNTEPKAEPSTSARPAAKLRAQGSHAPGKRPTHGFRGQRSSRPPHRGAKLATTS